MHVFDNEFMPHIDSMYNFAYRLTFDEDDSKDLVQDTYMKAYRFINSFQEGTNAKAWLYRILKNSFINDYRKKSKQPAKVGTSMRSSANRCTISDDRGHDG